MSPLDGGLALRVESGSQAGLTVPVGQQPLTIGRDPEADVVLDDDRVSRRHAVLAADGTAGLLLRDLSSTNGTWLGERRIEGAAPVAAGSRIRVGATWLAIVEREDASPPAAAGVDQSGMRRLQEQLRQGRRWVRLLAAGVAFSLLLAAVLVATTFTRKDTPAPAQVAARSAADVAAGARPGTVQVRVDADGNQVAAGSGWVLDAEQGLIVTNHHVISSSPAYSVAVEGRTRPAKLVATAPCDDLALLQVADRGSLRTLPLGAQSDLRAGDQVVALGYPANAADDNSLTITVGVVSVVRTTADSGRFGDVVQTDAAINPGNSGGPLLGTDGRLVGVNTLTLESESGPPVQNQNYAIGVDRVKEVTATLRQGLSPAWTGLWLEEAVGDSPLERLARRNHALMVLGAAPGTPAEAAGLRGPMLLTHVQGRRLDGTMAGYCRAVGGLHRGEQVALSVVELGGPGDPGSAPDATSRVVRLPLLG